MRPGEKTVLKATVRSDAAAPISPELLAFSYHWRDAADPKRIVVWDGVRTAVNGPIAPGAESTAQVAVVAPEKVGRYLLEIDLVREGVSWASGRGVAAPRQEVIVR